MPSRDCTLDSRAIRNEDMNQDFRLLATHPTFRSKSRRKVPASMSNTIKRGFWCLLMMGGMVSSG